MEKLPTTEEIISIVEATVAAYSNSPVWYKTDIKKYMIEFAKLHVEAALKAASEKTEIPYIMLAKHYPLDNIK
jgi:hypothetical protein